MKMIFISILNEHIQKRIVVIAKFHGTHTYT